jgi:hypothetical protein
MCKANPKVVLKQLSDFLDALFDSPSPPPTPTHTNKIPQGAQKDVYHHYPNYQRKFGNQLVVQFLYNFV